MARTLDQMLATEKPEVVAKAQKAATEMLLNIHLAELRDRMNLTQGEIAASLGVRQPTVSEMEKPGRDLKLSSIKRYVEASGGKLRLDVELPDGTHYALPFNSIRPVMGRHYFSCSSSSRFRYISPARSLPSSVSLKASFREAFRYLFNRPFSTSVWHDVRKFVP
ncbi:hypothetical protein SEEHRA23_16430 [Salmonella enterica subsp. enterica serovar Heidelberg str. SARA33]|nr:hypothetical protein SEEHRA23_16430 [Salmonella enterica subsp. enterica serovar Heidelberg str. SARA33]